MKILMNYKKDNKELVTYWKAVLVVLAAVTDTVELEATAERPVVDGRVLLQTKYATVIHHGR